MTWPAITVAERVPAPPSAGTSAVAPALVAAHPLADAALAAELARRATQIADAFDAIEPVLRELAPHQFEADFVALAQLRLRSMLGIDVPADHLRAEWTAPLNVAALYAHCVLAVFCRLVNDDAERTAARTSDGEDVATLVRRWGFHAIDIAPCADGRLAGVVDYILRIPNAVVTAREATAGAMFDVADTLRRWEHVELGRWRDGVPNAATEPTRYLKIGVYHFSGSDPHGGCAAHGYDRHRAATALLERLAAFEDAVRNVHGCGACTATLLVGVDTDTDALRVHVPDGTGRTSVDRFVDAGDLYERTCTLAREAAKDAIRDAVAAAAHVAPDDHATEGMRWFCGYLLKNNIGQIDAVRAQHGAAYAERGHTERLIVLGDSLDDVQLRNLAFTAQSPSVEQAAATLDIGLKILAGLHEPRGLAIPLLAHVRFDARIPGADEEARADAARLRDAVLARYADLALRNRMHVHAVVSEAESGILATVPSPATVAAP